MWSSVEAFGHHVIKMVPQYNGMYSLNSCNPGPLKSRVREIEGMLVAKGQHMRLPAQPPTRRRASRSAVAWPRGAGCALRLSRQSPRAANGLLKPPSTCPVIMPGMLTRPMTFIVLRVGVRPVENAWRMPGSAASRAVAPAAAVVATGRADGRAGGRADGWAGGRTGVAFHANHG